MADKTVHYYLSLNSPWSYLGHERLVDIAARNGARVRIHPVDFAGVIFPATGGVPVPKRPKERQAYRLAELARWRDVLGVPLNLHPAHWPADERAAAGMVIGAREAGADTAAVALAGACLRAVWAEDRDIAERDTLIHLATAVGLDAAGLLQGAEGQLGTRERESREAIELGVFGAPSYVIGGDIFWGQDRLDFVDRVLRAS